MTRGARLTPYQLRRIKALARHGMGQRAISRTLGISLGAIYAHTHKRGLALKSGRRGRPPKVSDTTRRAVTRSMGADKTCSIRSMKRTMDQAGIGLSTATIGRIMQHDKNIVYDRAKKRRNISDQDKNSRLDWARQTQENPPDWDTIVFADEKRWSLDGPDGVHKSWIKKNEKRPTTWRRPAKGGSVMVWGGFSWCGTTKLAFIDQNLNKAGYENVLKTHLVPVICDLVGPVCRLLQDNATVHTAKNVQKYLKSQKIQPIVIPPRSPDMNPIENLWGILTSEVYKGGVQYHTKSALKTAVQRAWARIDKGLLMRLATSMTTRCKALIEAKGADTRF